MMVNDIPIIWVEPAQRVHNDLIIWLPGFGGTKESVLDTLTSFANEGYTAVSFDPYQHGERRIESQDQFVQRIRSNIRRHFWPILAHTAEEFPQVIDWAMEHLGIDGKIHAGGVSMGGDIAVTAAGVDPRIDSVSAWIATADWLRPGSNEPPGEPDSYASSCYDRRNPLTNLQLYHHGSSIQFLCGQLDRQVPSDGAWRFVKALQEEYPDYTGKLQVFEYDGYAHSIHPDMYGKALEWFRSG
ncbi:alpha/beta hydrolase family protein [Paenibacillus spongiae]|uniref:Alpha/beta fold hydrolase n=1 Tax=Paenibacillus spongiae TaxID=2909671 RepID=A0ABY5SHT8_9BACL|nr:alpha/beta fold hydrolase [Paenibacillus spongiae]UVI33549.1 alpha/beta fold hydrolase [Paenibacillus spongiae]